MNARSPSFRPLQFCVLAILLASSSAALRAEGPTWARSYGGASTDRADRIANTSDGGSVLLGHTASYGSGAFNLWILKLTSEGEVDWEKVYPTATPMNPASIKQVAGGGYIVCGSTQDEAGGPAQAWVARLDSEGSILWQRFYGDPSMPASLHHVVDTADGGLVGTGYLYLDAVGAFVYKVWVIKWDAAGGVDWQNTYWSAGNGFGRDVHETGDGGYIVSALATFSSDRGQDFWVLRLNSTGGVLWQKAYGGPTMEYDAILRKTPDGGYALAGNTTYPTALLHEIRLYKLDAGGQVEWEKNYFGDASLDLFDIEPISGGGYLAAGYRDITLQGLGKGWLAKLDANGEFLWHKDYGTGQYEIFRSVILNEDGGATAAGDALSWGSGGDAWVVRTDSAGNLDPSCAFVADTLDFARVLTNSALATGAQTAVPQTPASPGAVSPQNLTPQDALICRTPCTVECTASVPATGVAGEPVPVSAEAALSNCVGEPTFYWIFGDGTTANGTTGTHTYLAPGTYEWSLEVMADGIICLRTGTITVAATPPCTVACTASVPATGFVWSATRFDVEVILANCAGAPTFFWTFGDGSTATGNKGTHAYLEAGTYDWVVEVMADGVMCVRTGTIVITESPCTIACAATVPATGFVLSATQFLAEPIFTGCTEPATYHWNFGDGSTAGGGSVAHAYLAPGTYQWAVTVSTQGFTCIQAGSIVITESPCTIECHATVPATGAVLDTIPFTAEPIFTGCTEPATYHWNFGDGSTADGQSVTHAYQTPGAFDWAVTVTTEGFTCIRAGTITVSSQCTVACTASVPATGFVFGATWFVAEATLAGCTEPATYLWTLGDGTTVPYRHFAYGYQAPGTYDWAVEVMADGVMCVQTGTITITESPCTVECTATVPATGFVLSATSFVAEATLTGCSEPATFLWNFGDGSTATGQGGTHGYLAPGTYNWYVEVTAQGYTCIKAGTIEITQSPCTIQCVAAVPSTGEVLAPIPFAGEATLTGCSTPAAFLWNFGDGTTATDQGGTHAYLAPGTYHWTFSATADGFTCMRAGVIEITQPPCTVACTATVPATGVALSPTPFSAEAVLTDCVGAPSFTWIFGDGTTATGNTGTHTYLTPGTYAWSLEVMADGVICLRTGTVAVEAGIPGDGNGDGAVSIGEVQQSINMFLGIQPPGNGADCNGDDSISIGEVQKVINAFLGLAVSC